MTDQLPRKFRVWDDEEVHEPPHNFHLRGDGHIARIKEFGAEYEISPRWEAMFNTGLTDAEGAEVWEGDVLEYSLSGNHIQRAKVIYRCASFMLERRDGIYLRLNKVIAGLEYDATVIGNRYEDPELMEEVSNHE